MRGLSKGRCSKFCVDSRLRLERPEKGRMAYRAKHYEYINNDEDFNPKILNDDKANSSITTVFPFGKSINLPIPRVYLIWYK